MLPINNFNSSINQFSDLLNTNSSQGQGNSNNFDPLNLFSKSFPGMGGGQGIGGNITPPRTSFMDTFNSLFGTSKNPGPGGQLLNGLGGAANTFLALQQFGLVKDSLKQNKAQFNRQYDAQKQITNAQIRDRASARHSVNPNNPTAEEVLARDGIR